MNVPVALRRLWIQLTSDRKRFGLFCTMLGVGLLLWARLIVITNTPRTAVADDEAETAPAEADEDSDEQTTARPKDRTPVRVVLDERPSRDPFVISPQHFPEPSSVEKNVQEAGKSDVQPAEDSEEQKAARVAEHVAALKLEAVLFVPAARGGDSFAVINGETYRVNDVIPVPGGEIECRLVHVRERAVTLECDGRQFEKSIARPGDQ